MWSARTRGDAWGGRRGRANSALPYNGHGGGEKRRENCGRAEALPYNGYGGEEQQGGTENADSLPRLGFGMTADVEREDAWGRPGRASREG